MTETGDLHSQSRFGEPWYNRGILTYAGLTGHVVGEIVHPYTTTGHYIRHECGHIVVGKVLGFETTDIIIEEGSAGAGTDQFFSCPTIQAVSDHLLRRIQVLYAGAIAQTLAGNKIDGPVILILYKGTPPQNTAAHDFAKIKELLRVWIAIRYPNATHDHFARQLLKADRVLFNSAVSLVIKDAPLIHEIAHAVSLAYQRAGRPKKFTYTKDQIEALPSVKQRFP